MRIALKFPDGQTVDTNLKILNQGGLKGDFKDIGSFLTPLLEITFYIAVFLTFFYLVWAAFQYIIAGGKKEDLAKARQRINWALVGLIVVFLAFFVAKFASEIFPSKGGLPF